MKLLTLSVCLLALVPLCLGYEILLAAPLTTKHMNDVFCSIAKALANDGNIVTLISRHPPNFYHENFTIYKLSGGKNILQDLNLFLVNSSTLHSHVTEVLRDATKSMWEGYKIKDLVSAKDKYDAVIIPAFLNELAYPFLVNYTGVFVTVYSQGVEHFVVSRGSDPDSLNPALDDPYFGAYSFQKKFLYSVAALNKLPVENSGVFPGTQRIVQMYQPKVGDVTKYRSLSRLNLVVGHSALEGLTPLMPKQVQIGNIAAKAPDDLPLEIMNFLLQSPGEGIVYVSLGSYTKSTMIPANFKKTLQEALSRLPHKVLWQYDGMDLEKHRNLLTKKVMPQQDILGHPDTVAFISYCSLASVQEAAFHGVPVLALPLALDQPVNADKLVRRGLAIRMDWRTATADEIVQAVKQLTGVPAYSSKMLATSRVMQDEKEPAGELAAWWVQYTIRHEGAPHMQYDPAEHAVRSYCDHELLKAWAVLAAVLGLLVGALLMVVFRALHDCLCRPNSAATANKRKNE